MSRVYDGGTGERQVCYLPSQVLLVLQYLDLYLVSESWEEKPVTMVKNTHCAQKKLIRLS